MYSHTALNAAVIVMESNMMCNFLLKTQPLRPEQVESAVHYDLLLQQDCNIYYGDKCTGTLVQFIFTIPGSPELATVSSNL